MFINNELHGIKVMPKATMFGMYFIAAAILVAAALVANPIRHVNAQGNATNVTGVGVVKITTIDTDSLIKALKTKFPKLAALTGAEDRDLIGGLKDLKDPKETAKTIIAANLMRDLIQYKAIQEMQ